MRRIDTDKPLDTFVVRVCHGSVWTGMQPPEPQLA